MSTYGYSKQRLDNNASPAHVVWLLIGIISPLLIWSTFQTALFNGPKFNFDIAINIAALITAMIGIITAIAANKYLKWETHKDALTILVWLLPLSYGVSYLNATSKYNATSMLLIMTMYVIFYLSSYLMTKHEQVNRSLQYVVLITYYIIVLFGLFHWMGNGVFINSLVKWMGTPTTVITEYLPIGTYRDAVKLEPAGARLTSIFQYAKTYASFLMAFLFAALFFIGRARTWWEKAIHSFMLVPIILSILLTLSRGGLLFLPVVLLILLIFLKPYRQLIWIAQLAVSGVLTLAILSPVTSIGMATQVSFNATQSIKGWTYIVVAAIITSAISILAERFRSPWLEQKLSSLANKRWGNLLLPIGGTVVSGLLLFMLMGTSAKQILPDKLQSQLENINFEQHSVLERLTFYKDSAKLIADYPLIGAGGGAWVAMYEQYQNNPYISRQAHSFYMQYLVEAGIIGFALFSAFLAYIFYHYIRTYIRADQDRRDRYFPYFIIALSILIHSVMDFNMSYALIGILVFICLGGMTTFMDTQPLLKLKMKPKSLTSLSSLITGFLSIILLIISITYTSAASSFTQALEVASESNDYTAISAPLDKALSIRPNHPFYVDMKTSMDTQIYSQMNDDTYYNQAYNLLHQALKAEPYNKMLYQRLMLLYETKDLNQDILNIYKDNQFRYPWDIAWYEGYMKTAAHLAALSLEDQAEKTRYITTVLGLQKDIEAGMEYLKTLPEGQMQGRAFEITQKVALYVGQAYYLNGQLQEANDLLRTRLRDQLVTASDTDPTDIDTTNVDILRWYLATTEKLGLTDEVNHAKLMTHDPNEDAMIEAIVNLKVQ